MGVGFFGGAGVHQRAGRVPDLRVQAQGAGGSGDGRGWGSWVCKCGPVACSKCGAVLEELREGLFVVVFLFVALMSEHTF